MRGLVLGLAAFLLSGCSAGSPPPGVMVFGNGAEPETLDPALMVGLLESTLAIQLFEGLTRLDPQTLEPEPAAASSWEIKDSGRTYIFHLRPAFWSDGKPVTAEDFKYSWIRALRPDTAAEYAYQLFPVKGGQAFNAGKLDDPSEVGLRVLGPRTLEVKLNNPTPYFLSLTSFMTLLPVRKDKIESFGRKWTRPENLVGNGPYILAEHRPHRRIVLKKNPFYWEADKVEIDEIQILPIEDANTALRMYLAGQLHWIRSIPLEKRDVYRDHKDFHQSPSFSTSFLRFNLTRKPFDDPRVRKALAMALDRKTLCEKITRGGEIPWTSLVPSGLPGYKPIEGHHFNPEKARELLAEAGYPGGKGFPERSYLHVTREGTRRFAEAIQEMWRKHLGIRLTLVSEEWKVYLKSMTHLKFDIVASGWIGDYLDPNTFLDMFVTDGGNNRTGFSDPEYDSLIAQAARESDPEIRNKLFQRCEEILVREAVPIIPLYMGVNLALINQSLEGVEPNLDSHYPLRTARFVENEL